MGALRAADTDAGIARPRDRLLGPVRDRAARVLVGADAGHAAPDSVDRADRADDRRVRGTARTGATGLPERDVRDAPAALAQSARHLSAQETAATEEPRRHLLRP